MLGILLLIFIILQQYLIRNTYPKEEDLLEKIERIEKKLDSMNSKKDSIKSSIIVIEQKLDSNEYHHVETTNTILNQSDSANRAFIDNYLRQYWSKK